MNFTEPSTWRLAQVLGATLVVTACGDDLPADDTTEGGTTGATGSATDDPTGGGPGPDTEGLVVGDKFGLLSFSYYPPTASGLPEELGMAGAWRTEPFTTDDFYAVQAWSMHLPPAPEGPDTVEYNAIPTPYDWGQPESWATAGNALKLRHGAESVACLSLVGDGYPVYLSDDAEFFDPACAPDPTRWLPGATYDVIAFGGDLADDAILPAAVETPPALTITSPDLSTSLFPLDRAAPLGLAWEPGDDPEARIIVRLIDTFGQMLTAHAADDGAFTIPAAELGKLAPGPATLTLARERLFDLGFPVGTLRVALRYEIWADPDLL